MLRPPFKFSARTRVGFSDTDAQGVVYYGRYNPYFDLARVEYLRALGLLHRPSGGDFVMRANDVEYFAPARFDDELEIHARVSRIGRTSVTFEFAAYKIPDDTAARHRAPDARLHRPRRAQGGAGARRLPREASSSSRATMPSTGGALEAIDRILNRGGDADDILRQVVAALHDGRPATPGPASSSSRTASSSLGPQAGTPDESRRTSVPGHVAGRSRRRARGRRRARRRPHVPRARRPARLRSLPRRLGHRRRVLGTLNLPGAAHPAESSSAGRRSLWCALSPHHVLLSTRLLSIPRSRVRTRPRPDPSFEGTAWLYERPRSAYPPFGVPRCSRSSDPRTRDCGA